MLGEALLEVCGAWRGAFARQSSHLRSIRLAIGFLCGIGRATTSRSILALGQKEHDWSADYRLFSRAPWEAEEIFDSVLETACKQVQGPWVVVAFDDTRLKKTGRKIPNAQYYKDPLSPPFHVNLVYGLRFLQCSLMLPLHETSERGARGIPISFELAPNLKKPGKRATQEARSLYEKEKSVHNLSVRFGASLIRQRTRLDEIGLADRFLLATVDGSFCNSKCLRQIPERTAVLARARKDAKLCFAAPQGSRRKYGADTFTPESVRQNPDIPYGAVSAVFGGTLRELRVKRIDGVLWRGGTKTRRLTLLVLAPTPYQNSQGGKVLYRQPAYLLCTQTGLDTQSLVQAYIDRWQIEVNHRDEKDILGVGQAQVWSEKAVPRQPAFAVAAYSALLLATLIACGPGRTDAFPPLPKWRKHQRRPSVQDMIAVLRQEFADPNSPLNRQVHAPPGFQNLVINAAA